MKVFISSVRQGLEDERDSLPGIIQALGHEPRRFEDFSARSVPSRQACLDGVEEADAYVLLIGPKYGDILPETGKSPTEEEFTVAKRRGIPIRAFRKRGVTLEPEQQNFVDRIEQYSTGIFRNGFTSTSELLTEVTRAIKELELAPPPLVFSPLATTPEVPWAPRQPTGWHRATTLELVAIPIDHAALAATALAAMPSRLAALGRETGFFGQEHALDTGIEHGSAYASTRADRYVAPAGLRVTASGAVNVWQALPSDMLGVILDADDVTARVAQMLPIAASLVSRQSSVALAIGLNYTGSVVEGRSSDLGRRTSATMSGFGQERDVRVEPRDSIAAASISSGANEVARELSTRLLLAFRDVNRR